MPLKKTTRFNIIDQYKESAWEAFRIAKLIWDTNQGLSSKNIIMYKFSPDNFPLRYVLTGEVEKLKSVITDLKVKPKDLIPYALLSGNKDLIDFIFAYCNLKVDDIIERNLGSAMYLAFQRHWPEVVRTLSSMNAEVVEYIRVGYDSVPIGQFIVASGDLEMLKVLVESGYNLPHEVPSPLLAAKKI